MRVQRSRTRLSSYLTFDSDINPVTTTAQLIGSPTKIWDAIYVEAIYGTARTFIVLSGMMGG